MSSRGGRDRSRRDYPSRYEDKGGGVAAGRGNSSSNSRSNNPPSRHIWVGNLSHNIIEEDLAHHFLKFGPLESVAFQPGRSYAFLNFEREEDAIEAIRALQGFPLAGNPLRIEFTKAVSVAHLLQLVTFPNAYIYVSMFVPHKFNSIQLIKIIILSYIYKSEKLRYKNVRLQHTTHCFSYME
ncbi:unnamed protein product [Lupinus luteus]|uniref:RRM domain-containing protein n=1 Tax=Lupinus luteus TaxID=3873 RepID=A0AAV1XAT2_LUPLU